MPAGNPAWKEGVSGNPHGRPKKDCCFSDALREMLAANEVDVTLTFEKDGADVKKHIHLKSDKTIRYALAAVLVASGFEGNSVAINSIIERLEGKAEQPVTFNPDEVTFLPAFTGKPPETNEAHPTSSPTV